MISFPRRLAAWETDLAQLSLSDHFPPPVRSKSPFSAHLGHEVPPGTTPFKALEPEWLLGPVHLVLTQLPSSTAVGVMSADPMGSPVIRPRILQYMPLIQAPFLSFKPVQAVTC